MHGAQPSSLSVPKTSGIGIGGSSRSSWPHGRTSHLMDSGRFIKYWPVIASRAASAGAGSTAGRGQRLGSGATHAAAKLCRLQHYTAQN